MDYHLAIVGDAGVGKSTLMERWQTGKFQPSSTSPVVIRLATSLGWVKLTLPSQQAQAGLIIFDLSRAHTFRSVRSHFERLTELYGSIPIILCGNKCDLKEDAVTADEICRLLAENPNWLYFPISARSLYNLEKPLLFAARRLYRPEVVTYAELQASPLYLV